jgi:hypothetical protein
MLQVKRWVLLISVMVGAGGVLTGPAFGEFQSSKAKGSGEVVELQIEAGGGKVICQNFSPPTKDVAWTIKSGGVETTKGAGLLSKIESWGECTIESGSIAKTKATLGSCDLELKQSGTETEILGGLDNTCTVTSGACEIKADQSSNEKLNAVNLEFAGEADESLIFEPLVTNLTTLVSSCPGVTATTKGKFTGLTELELVKPSAAAVLFSIGSAKKQYKLNEAGKVKVTNKGEERTLSGWATLQEPPATFESNAAQEKVCEEKKYAEKEGCEFQITAKKESGFKAWRIIAGAFRAGLVVRAIK